MSFLLPPPPEGYQGPTEVVSSLSGWPYQRTIEPAGRRFAAFLKKKTGEYHEEEENKQEETGNADEDAKFTARVANKHKTWSKEKAEDYYELVGLGDLRWRANPEEIKASYRKMILIYHPDKMKAASEKNQEVNDEIFKSIQKAYDVLSDPKKRRAYDSTEEFDDTIPSERQADREDFFKLFDPIFERNARWSNIQPAPKLGDINTPYEEVKKFYDFWWEFKSWRGFRHADEYDLEQADSSDERRWMNKQNEKLSAPLVRQERARLLKLSELAHKKDPRVIKYEEEKEAEKRKKKNAKKDERRAAQDAIDKEIAAEKQKKDEEEKVKIAAAIEAKKKREKDVKAYKRKQKRLRDLCRALPAPPSEEHLDYICNKLNSEQLGDLLLAMSPPDAPATKAPFDELVTDLKAVEKEKDERQREEDAQRKANLNRPWGEEELSNLAKGLAKFPGGLSNRWELIADLLPTRTAKEIASKVKEVKTNQMFTNKAAFFQAMDPFEKLKNTVAARENAHVVAAPASEATTTTTSAPAPVATPVVIVPAPSSTSAATPAPAPAASKKAAAGKSAPAAAATTDAPATPASPPVPAVEWSADEQKLLEKGIQKFPASIDDRWEKIAQSVKTKNKKECIARYKHLVNLYRGKK